MGSLRWAAVAGLLLGVAALAGQAHMLLICVAGLVLFGVWSTARTAMAAGDFDPSTGAVIDSKGGP